MTHIEKLISFHVIERENNKNFLTWTYPTITDEQKKVILLNCFGEDKNEYICRRSGNTWFHIHQNIDRLFAVVILAKEFQPKKYRLLCDIFAKKYSKKRNPVDLVALYLDLCTSGSCKVSENGTTYDCDFKNFKCATNIKEFIQSFDLEIILLYTAIILKRRVLLFSTNTELLLNDLLALSNLVPSRNVNDYLYPNIDSSSQLKGLSFYVAGSTNGDLIKEDSLYDLFVNVETLEISISPKAEEIMSMTKTHKEIATFLVKLSASDLSETEIRQQILDKTKDLLSLLKSLATVTTVNNVKMITINDLKSKKYHPQLENFLFNLAVAENMMML